MPLKHLPGRRRPNLNPMIAHSGNQLRVLPRAGHVRVRSQWHVALDAQPIDGLAGELALSTVIWLMAFKAPVDEEFLAATLIPMRIVTSETRHFRLLKALTLFESPQLVGGVRVRRRACDLAFGGSDIVREAAPHRKYTPRGNDVSVWLGTVVPVFSEIGRPTFDVGDPLRLSHRDSAGEPPELVDG